MIRAALIRLLWRAVADQDECDDRDDCSADPLDICDAMRALGYGDHWNAETFQKRAIAEKVPCEFCRQAAHRVRCQGCCRDICARCMAVPNCDHDENGIHQEGGS